MTYFVAVCKYKTISKAAEEMYVSQPAISSAIKELEEDFGVKLFRRQGNNLVLTEAGNEFLISCEKILNQTEILREKMRNHGSSNVTMKIGVPPMIATLLFPRLYQQLYSRHPKLKLEIFEQGSIWSRKKVSEGAIDLAFAIADNLDDNTMDKHVLFATELVYCVAKSHRLAGKGTITWDDLAEEKIVMMKEDSYQYQQLKDKFAKHNSMPDILLHSSQLATISKFVQEGYAGAFFFEEVAKADDNITYLKVSDPITASIACMWKKSSRQLDNINLILNVAKSMFE